MADGIQFEVDTSGFGTWLAAAEAALEQAVEAEAETTSGDAIERCPVLTGALKASIGYRMTGPTEAEVEATEDYAAVVDEGNASRPANPYFTGPVEAARERFPKRVAEALAEVTAG